MCRCAIFSGFPSTKDVLVFCLLGFGTRNPSATVEGLAHLKNCLEILSVENEAGGPNWSALIDNPVSLEASLGSLSDFRKLKRLAVDAYILLQLKWYYTTGQISAFAKSLPPSLEFLHIRNARQLYSTAWLGSFIMAMLLRA